MTAESSTPELSVLRGEHTGQVQQARLLGKDRLHGRKLLLQVFGLKIRNSSERDIEDLEKIIEKFFDIGHFGM
jgi:hypothetical protein